MATFGNTTSESDGDQSISFWYNGDKNEYVRGIKDTPARDGYATSISAYIFRVQDDEESKCALYDASNNSKVAVTDEETITNTEVDWITFTFSEPPKIYKNKYYYIVLYSDAPESDPGNKTYVRIKKGYTGTGYGKEIDDYPTFPSTISLSTESGSYYAIYCTYTEILTKTINNLGDGRITTIGDGKIRPIQI